MTKVFALSAIRYFKKLVILTIQFDDWLLRYVFKCVKFCWIVWKIHMGAIMTHSFYICYPIFQEPVFVFKGFFGKFCHMYDWYSRAGCDQEWVMTRVRYFLRFRWFYVGLSDQCAHALETRWMNARQQLTQGRGPSIK